MNKETFRFEVITPCFSGGAFPGKEAEIRAPAMRGQLRWWFRVLGGFKSLAMEHLTVREQEEMIFGCAAGEKGHASSLIVRLQASSHQSIEAKPADTNSPMGYLLFPLRTQTRFRIQGAQPSCSVAVIWRGSDALWPDIEALFSVFGHIGAIGFRSRRAMGALALTNASMGLEAALAHFNTPNAIVVRDMPSTDVDDAISKLSLWLKDWRAHGRKVDHKTAKPPDPPYNSGFDPFAKTDHDAGRLVLAHKGHASDPTYRPSLGLPIEQFFSSDGKKVRWEFGRESDHEGKGRFASPVILRPHRDGTKKWHALVIFVDAYKWPEGHDVYLDGKPRKVSLDLYEAMKQDKRLQIFHG